MAYMEAAHGRRCCGHSCLHGRARRQCPSLEAQLSTSGAYWPAMTAVLATLLGGFLAIAGAIVGIALGDRRDRSRWLRESQWPASTNLLSALQLLVRRMINVFGLDP